jgi:PhzF family phenazine biosynthesis protein
MHRIKIKQVDAFTLQPHTGNPAGVVVDGDRLSEAHMQSIAREMALSETSFILSSTKPGADVRIRWFTPTVEVPLCGHATVASFHALAEEGRLGMKEAGTYSFNLETASGILPVTVERAQGTGRTTVMFGMKVGAFEKAAQFKIDLLRVLNITISEFETALPLVRHGCLYVPVRRLHTLFTMKPNFLAIANFLATRNIQGMCVYTLETIDRESSVHSRYFDPNAGINEDPATGSAHAPLAALLYENGIIQADGDRCVFQAEQGDAIGRRGRLSIELRLNGGKPSLVMVGGNAVTVLEGEMLLHEDLS